MEKLYYIHPLFSGIERNFRYFLIATGMLTQKSFQQLTQKRWNTMSIETSVEFDGNKFLIFDVEKTIEQFNKEFNVVDNGNTTTLNFNAILETQARLMVIYLYESISESHYCGLIPRTLDNFVYHLRNAAAHDNKFFIVKRKGEEAKWRNKTINLTMQGSPVFNMFIRPADIILLTVDLSEELKKIDKASTHVPNI